MSSNKEPERSPVEKILGYQFQDPSLLIKALTHKSYHFEFKVKSIGHNEKLEFLGDAVLDLVLSEILIETFPEDGEGALSKKRASLVNETILSQVALTLRLNEFLKLGKGENQTGGATKPRLLGSAYEAVLGALHQDAGYEFTKNLIRQHFQPIILKIDPTVDYEKDYKTRLQEVVQKKFKATPVYEVVSEIGPPHNRDFIVALKIQDQVVSQGQGRSKKQAEQEAARQYFIILSKESGETYEL
jgi:ribonuclease-3